MLAEAQLPDPNLLEESIRLLRALSWQGVAMVEFKFDSVKQRWWLMEVNGHIEDPCRWHWLGVPFPYGEWMVAPGPFLRLTYSASMRIVWRFGSLQVLLRTVKQWRRNRSSSSPLRAGLDFLGSLLSLAPDAVWNWNDLRGSLQEYKVFIKAGLLKVPLVAPLWESACIGRAHGMAVGFRYLRQRVRRAFGLRRTAPPDLKNVREILFVCSGNIIRSVLAEAMLRKLLPENGSIRARSAGLLTTQGRPADPRAVVARQRGLSLEGHRSTPVARLWLKVRPDFW